MARMALSQRLTLALIVATATATPGNLNDNCNEAIAIVGGASPGFGAMGGSAPGNANAGALTDGGTLAPGATYQLANTGGGQYGLYASEGTVNPTSGCANKYSANAGTTWTAPQAGTASLVSMRSTGRGRASRTS